LVFDESICQTRRVVGHRFRERQPSGLQRSLERLRSVSRRKVERIERGDTACPGSMGWTHFHHPIVYQKSASEKPNQISVLTLMRIS
jgi:hypothetical protein